MRKRVVVALLVALVAGLLVGCARGGPSPDTGPAAGAVLEGPALALDRVQADLGTMPMDLQGLETFLVMNMGDQPLQVTSVDIQVEEGCDQVETVEEGVTVAPGKMSLVPVFLGPHREPGPHRLVVRVSSNDPEMPVATLTLRFNVKESPTVQASGPRLLVDKEVVDIGKVPYDWPLYQQFALRNVGDAPLIIGLPQVRVEEGC